MLKVVFHVDEVDRWSMVLTNAKYFKALEPNSSVIILANGSAVLFYIHPHTSLVELTHALQKDGIQFEACRNALKGYGIAEAILPQYVMPVDSGVVELAKRQADGYAYIRP